MNKAFDAHDQLKAYYGRILASSRDLKTNARCSSEESIPAEVRSILKEIDDEIVDRFYGCGSALPPVLEGCTVLDLDAERAGMYMWPRNWSVKTALSSAST